MISARLNPEQPMESQALEYVDMALEQGYNLRHILTDAILYRNGHKPEMYHHQQLGTAGMDEINAKLDAILNALEEKLPVVLRDIRRADPDGLRRFASADEGDELDSDFIENSRRAVRKTFRQKQQEGK